MSKWFKQDEFEDFSKKLKEAEKEEESQRKSFGNLFPKYSKPYDTTYVLRFLPALKDTTPTSFYRKRYYHSFQSQDGSWKWITCPWTYGEKKCPICRIVSKLYASSEKEDRKVAKNLSRKLNHLANVYVVDDPRDKKDEDEKISGTVKILSFGVQIEKKIRNASQVGSRTGLGSGVIDPEEGYDFLLKVVEKKTGEEVYPNYEESDFARGVTTLADNDKRIQEIMDHVFSLEEYLENERTSISKIMEILEEEMLDNYLDDYEKEQLVEEDGDNPLDDDPDKTPEAPKEEEPKEEKPKEEQESKPDPEKGSEEAKNLERQQEALKGNSGDEEEEADFLKKLDALEFDD